jgi:uncharacterized protein
MKKILRFAGFDWDKGNLDKNWLKHKVANAECEEMFFNQPLLIIKDEQHSQKEERRYALGKTESGRLLFASFTVRNNNIRIISARDMSKHEREQYAKS